MNHLTRFLAPETIMYAVLIFFIVWLIAATMRRSRDPHSLLSIEDLLLGDDGRISKTATVMFGAFLLTTWMMIYMLSADKMTEGYMTIYVGAWVAPAVAKIVSAPKEK